MCIRITSHVIYVICVQPLPELVVVMAWVIQVWKPWLMRMTCMLYDIISHLVIEAIYRLGDRERVSISCHTTSLLSVWLCLAKFTLENMTDDVISNLTLVSHEPIMRPESGWRNAFIYVTGSGLIANDAHPAAWVCLCVYFSCGQRRCFTIKRGTHRQWGWYCASQAETGLIPSCCYQGGEKPICGIYQHEHAHKYSWTYAGTHNHIILPVVKEK